MKKTRTIEQLLKRNKKIPLTQDERTLLHEKKVELFKNNASWNEIYDVMRAMDNH